MKRLLLLLVLGISCLYTYGQSVTYRILARSSQSANERNATSEFEKDSGYVVVDDDKVSFYDAKWHRMASVDCQNSSTDVQDEVVYMKSRGSMGRQAVSLTLVSKNDITDDNPNVLRLTFTENKKSFSYLLGSL